MKLRPIISYKHNPRQSRVIQALINTTEWISREQIDRIAGASNGPEVIRQLRKIYGNESIEMIPFPRVDRDGCLVKAGHYRLTPIGRMIFLIEETKDGEA